MRAVHAEVVTVLIGVSYVGAISPQSEVWGAAHGYLP